MRTTKTAIVWPWYWQFYLRRGDAECCSDRISKDGEASGLEVIGGFVYVGTTTYGSPTEVLIQTHSADPGPPQSADRSADAELRGEGDLAVLNWNAGDSAVTTIGLPHGVLRLRASWYGTVDAVAHPDAEVGGEALSPERIVFDLWPTP